jgi:predicted ATPase
LFTDNFQYLNAERIGPRQSYGSSTSYIETRKQIGSKGEYAVHYLNVFGTSERIQSDILHHPKARSRALIHEVDAWLSEISPGTKLNTTAVPGTEMVLLDIQFETTLDFTNRFRPVNVGFGISFVLPVVLSLLLAKKDRLIIIENPEAHLHPRGQAEMGRLMALAAQTGAQIIAETHSDHILNGVRVAVKNGDIAKEDTRIFFFDRKTTDFEQFSHVVPIRIDHKGELSEYPPNFLDEWNNQLFKLI